MRRLAGSGEHVWRFPPRLSPLVPTCGVWQHATAYCEPPAGCRSRCDLELMAAPTAAAQAPGRDALLQADDQQIAIEEHDVDREAHPERVDAPERIRQEQSRVRVEPASPEEPPGAADAERRDDLQIRDQRPVGIRVDEFDHDAILPPLAAPRTRGHVAECDAMRTLRAPRVRGCDPLSPLRYAPRMHCEDFHSGDDVTLGFLGRTYSFARRDFEQRVVRAAVDLELTSKPVSRGERADVVRAAIVGSVDDPRSDVGERIAELQARGGEDPVYWLRKLVFRSAWLDHRIKHGQVDVAYDDSVGAFRIEPGKYPLPGSGHPSFAVSETSA